MQWASSSLVSLVAGVGVGGVPRRLVMTAMDDAALDRDDIADELQRVLCGTVNRSNEQERADIEEAADAIVALVRPVNEVKAEALADAERRMFGTTDGDLLPDDSNLPVGELRRLLWVGVDPKAGVES